jgi:hypothetical protein
MNKAIASIHPDGGRDPRIRQGMACRARWIFLGLLGLALILGLGLMGWFMLHRVPPRYQAFLTQQKQITPEHRALVAHELQKKLLGGLSIPWGQTARAIVADLSKSTPQDKAEPPSEPALPHDVSQILDGLIVKDLGTDEQGRVLRQIELGAEQANAWLAVEFDDWLQYRDFQPPSQLSQPMVDIHDGQTTLFFTYQDDNVSQVFQANFQLKLDDPGQATLKLTHLQAGQVPVPVDAMGAFISELSRSSADVEQAARWMDKIADARFKPVIKLPDGLKAQVIEYKVEHDKVIATLRIERYRPSYRHHPATGKLATVSQADQTAAAP